ncbi:MAG: DNA (cytosine-5-)-methyltransferase [Burkholderiales bacterium]|nr:DNA (cytosine-5-)-methyltransferase [Burkholderiales bacterium]
MRVGSLFSGVGGFDLGFERAGMGLAWHSEIEPHACAVLRDRWPDVPNLGDVTKIDGATIPPVDVICGGFPCQDLSVAGKRRGFEGERSVLAFEFLRIVREMREATDGAAPTFLVLENVPGLFTSAGGRDFGALLDALGDLRPMDVAWRVLDSRFFGVAQRRRRVFVVVDFGGERCDEVLALTEGLRWNPPSGRAAREDVAGTLGGGSSKRGWSDDLDRSGAFVTDDVAFRVLSREGKGPASSVDSGNIVVTGALAVNSGPRGHDAGNFMSNQAVDAGFIVAHTLRADGFDAGEDGTGRGTPIVPIAFDDQRGRANGGVSINQARTLHAAKGKSEVQLIAFDTTQVTSRANRSAPQPGAPCHTLAAGAHAPAVAFNWQNGGGYGDAHDGLAVSEEHTPPMSRSQVAAVAIRTAQTGANGIGAAEELAYTLDGASQGVATSGVRRLTPRETERLQAFPDDWTRYGRKPNGTRYELADGPRYKCMGNAVTVSVAEWIGKRIAVAICGAGGWR